MLKNLNERERLMVGAAVVISLLTFLWAGVYEPAIEKRGTLLRKIETQTGELMEVAALSKKYREAKVVFTALDLRLDENKSRGSLLSSLEMMAKGSGLGGNVTSMSPTSPAEIEGYQESGVELNLNKVSLPALVSLLEAIKAAPGYIRVKRLSIKTNYENPEYLEVSLTVAGYERVLN